MTDTREVEGLVARARKVVTFLNGEAGLNTVWFGERHPDHRGKFWWRREHLPEIDAALDAQEAEIRRLRSELEGNNGNAVSDRWMTRALAAAAELERRDAALRACVRRLDVIGEHFPDAIDGVTGTVVEDARALATGGDE